jgi:hypothetical protein
VKTLEQMNDKFTSDVVEEEEDGGKK